MHHVRAEQAQRREGARPRRHEYAAHVELFRDGRGVDGPGAAERQQREGREVDAALGREHKHFVGHAHVDDFAHARGGFHHAHAKRFGDLVVDGGARRGGVEFLRAAQEIIGIEIAAHDIGVGDGRVGSAASVAGGAGVGAGALRADGQETRAVDPRDGAAARGNRRHVERRNVDLPARDDALGCLQRRAALNEGDVGGGAAHVERHEPVVGVAFGEIGARLRAGGGAGEQRVDRLAAGDGGGEGHDAAIRLHEIALLRDDAGGVEPVVQARDIPRQHRLKIGVEQRRRHARPLAQPWQNLARDRHADVGRLLVEDAPRLFLVRGIHEREKVADRDRFNARVAQLARRLAHGPGVERRQHGAGVVGAFRYFAGEALRRDGLRLGVEIIEQVAVARLRLDFLHGAETLGDEHADFRAAPFQKRVRCDRGAMREEFDAARRRAARDEAPHAVEHAERRVLRRARHLLDHQGAGGDVEKHEVGVRAADIDAKPVTRIRHVRFHPGVAALHAKRPAAR